MHPTSSTSPNGTSERSALGGTAQQYRDEGYTVVEEPSGDQLPSFFAGFCPDLIASRGSESIAVAIKTDRGDLMADAGLTQMAEVINAQPGWRLDVIILRPETTIVKAMKGALEPTDAQLAQILRSAEELADTGYTPYAHVIAWSGLEAAMRRIQGEAELPGQPTPVELMTTLYSNGFLDSDQFRRLRESYKIRSQVVHGLVPAPVAPELVRFVSATARSLAATTP